MNREDLSEWWALPVAIIVASVFVASILERRPGRPLGGCLGTVIIAIGLVLAVGACLGRALA